MCNTCPWASNPLGSDQFIQVLETWFSLLQDTKKISIKNLYKKCSLQGFQTEKKSHATLEIFLWSHFLWSNINKKHIDKLWSGEKPPSGQERLDLLCPVLSQYIYLVLCNKDLALNGYRAVLLCFCIQHKQTFIPLAPHLSARGTTAALYTLPSLWPIKSLRLIFQIPSTPIEQPPD